jgi:hypothetical protein
MSDIEKQISVKLAKNAELAGAQELVDAQLLSLPTRGFSLHIQFTTGPVDPHGPVEETEA